MSLYSKFVNSLPALGRFTEHPAAMIDRAYLEDPKGILGHAWNFLKIRAIYTLFFLPLLPVDIVVSGLIGTRYSFGSFFTTDDLQARRLEQQKKYATIFSKSLYSLLSCIVGLISPKLIAFYFTPEKTTQEGVSAGGSYHHAPNAELKQPETIDELQTIIREAKAAGHKIMPMGAGRSQGKQFLAEGENAIVIDLKKFNTVQINATEKTATVGAGARWSDIQLLANPHKLALLVTQASNVFSVGGSIGTNVHGWDHIDGVLSNTILSMDIINAQGELKTLTPKDPLFHQITGGLGLFGMVVSAKIKLIDNEKLTEKGTDVAPKDYVKYFRDTVQASPNTRMHLYRLSLDPNHLLSSGVAVSYVKEDASAPVSTPNLSVEGDNGTRFNRVMINFARRVDWIRKLYWTGEKDRLLANKGPAMTRNEIMQPPINAMFNPAVSEAEWLQEYFLPGDRLEVFLKQLGQLLMDNHVPLLNASVRFVKQHDKSPLSYAHDGDRFAVVLCFNQSLQESNLIQAKKWLREAQHLATTLGGTYYLSYQHVSAPEDFKKAYPRAEEAQRYKQEVADPSQLFVSGFHQKYIAPQPDKPNYFKTIMASDGTKKEFAGFLKHVLQRVDNDKFYALLEDIMKYNDSHAEIYQELCNRLPEIMPGPLGSLSRIRSSLSAIKTDLAEQAQAILPDDINVINGLVEIGYPGRFVGGFQNKYIVTGNIAAVYEGKSITDYIQTGFPRPYHQFETLDYAKPNLSGLKSKSADVITCYVGLHHFPEAELETFLRDVRRVLRDGGHFLLVDHDVDDHSMSMAHMAHTIFNAVTGVSLEEEMAELRNFHPMSYWEEMLANYDLGYAVAGPNVAMIRAGDPSRNRMVSFVKREPQLLKIIDETQEPVADSDTVSSPTLLSTFGEEEDSGLDSKPPPIRSSVSDSTFIGSSPLILLATQQSLPVTPEDAERQQPSLT